VTKYVSDHDILQDLLLIENRVIDRDQQQLINRLRRHVQALWRHVLRIENVLLYSGEQLVIKVGDASLVMKKDGSVVIEANNVAIKASGRAEMSGGRITVKAVNTLTLKGQKIQEN
jgi:hypothetical protein